MSFSPLKSFPEVTESLTSAITKHDFNQIQDFVSSVDGAKCLLKWKLLANLRKRSSNELERLGHDNDTEKNVNWMLNDVNFLELIVCSGYVQEHRWIEVLEIMCRILAIDPAAKCGYKLRLAVAIGLTFSTPVKSLADQRVEIDALERYKSFASWSDAGELFHHFKDLTAWQLRYVVGSWATDDELVWARENAPLQFRSPKCIGEANHSMIKYKKRNEEGISVHDGARYYGNRPVTMAVMYEVGAVCGGISKFGCAMAQAFGVPAMPVGQPGHCAYLWWKEGEWVLSNDVSRLGKSVTHDGIQWTWDKSAEFVPLMEHAQKSFQRFVLSEKLRIAAKFCSRGTALELLSAAVSYSSSNYLLWRDLGELCKDQNVNRLNQAWILDMVKELDYFNETDKSTNQLLSKNSLVKVSDCHDQGQNIVDGTSSEWWTSNKSAWVEIDLCDSCIVTGVRIQWWGTSVSKNYVVYAAQEDGIYKKVKKTVDEIQKPKGYNSWSSLDGWLMKTNRVKFVLNDGSLDPWGFGRWFGIRQIVISGRRKRALKVLSKYKTFKTIGCEEKTQHTTDVFNVEFWAKGMNARVEIDLGYLCYLDKMDFQLKGDSSVKELVLCTSVYGRDFEIIPPKAISVTDELCDQMSLPINKLGSFVRVELENGMKDEYGVKKLFHLQNVMIYGDEISVKHLLVEKARKELSAWPGVEGHVCSIPFEADSQVLSSMAICRASHCQERAQNIIDGTQSEWWSESQDAWVEISLKAQSKISGVKIQWWGTSVSRDLTICAINKKGECDKVKSSSDETQSPVDYNDWSVFSGWDALTKTIRLDLRNGSLDPWGMGKYFGIRQIIVIGWSCS